MHVNVSKISHDKFSYILFSIVQIKWNIYVSEKERDKGAKGEGEKEEHKVSTKSFPPSNEAEFSEWKIISARSIMITIFLVKSMLIQNEVENWKAT